MSLNLRSCIQTYTNNNQERCTTEEKRYIELTDQQSGQNADYRDVNSTGKSQTTQNGIKVIRGCFARSDSRDIPTLTLDIFCYINRVKGNSRVEVTEEDNKSDIKNVIQPMSRSHHGSKGLHPWYVNKVCHGTWKHDDRTGKDRWDNTTHINLEWQVTALAASITCTHNALGVMNRNTTLTTLHKYDGPDNSNHDSYDN